MKIYQANEELKTILIKKGLIETTSCRDKRKGKHAFKLNKKSRKEIYFDYENIQIFDRWTEQDSLYFLTSNNLRHLLLFLFLDRKKYKLIEPSGKFCFNQAKKRLSEIEYEVNNFSTKKPKTIKSSMLKKILATYKEIEL